jgi:ATP-grasp domain, R2K clade family 2
MFETAFIQEQGNGRLPHESQLVRECCLTRGIPIQLYTIKRIQRRQLPLTTRSFICGDMDCMHGAMKQLGIPIPPPIYFPPSLQRYLNRAIWQDTVGGLRARLQDDRRSVFAKPAGRAKLFTGRVFAGDSDLYHLSSTSWREPVWCSEVVSWQSEYRVYVIGQDIVAVDHYGGDATVTLDRSIITEAITTYRSSGEAPAAYGIDFGVLATGETALVECNDGYALGAYQIAAPTYAELLFERWRELVSLSHDHTTKK